MYTLIRERVASMYELSYVYNLDEMLKLYDLIMMQRDIEYAKSQEDRAGEDRKSTRLNSSHRSQSRMPSSA